MVVSNQSNFFSVPGRDCEVRSAFQEAAEDINHQPKAKVKISKERKVVSKNSK